jgi:hypothetical protein
MKRFSNIQEYTIALTKTSTGQLPVVAMKEILERSKLHNPNTIDGAFALKQLLIAIDFAEMNNLQLQKEAELMKTESFKRENIEGYGI